MIIKNNKLYFENKEEQERFLKELQNRWQKLMNTCKEELEECRAAYKLPKTLIKKII